MPSFILPPTYRKPIFIALAIIIIAAFLLNCVNLFTVKKEYGTPDLRNRIVGSRLIKQKEKTSPYFYKWNKADGDSFLDMYDTPELLINRNTVTPFTLQLLELVCNTNYNKLARRWYIAEIISLLATVLLMLWLAKNSLNKIWILGVSLIGIGLSQGWMLHNLSGQIYIFIPLLLSVVLYFSKGQTENNNFFAALVFTVLILIRPTAVLFIAPFAVKSIWRVPVYTFVLLIIYFFFSYTAGEIWLWKDYLNAMNLWSIESFNPNVTKSYVEVFQLKEVEGSTTILQPPSLSLLEDSSLQGFSNRFLNMQLTKIPLLGLMLGLFIALIFFLRKKIKQFNLEKLFILAFLLYFLSELCIPAVRNSYNSVQWVFPLTLLFVHKQISNSIKLILFFAVTFAVGMMKYFPFDLFIAELLFFLSCSIYLKNTDVENA